MPHSRPPQREHGEITRLLRAHREGDASALDRLVPLIYDPLRRIARQQLSRGWSIETLNPTALVHEAYVRLVDETGIDWQSRSHFFAVSARTIRRILVDYARQRRALKRGGARRDRMSLDETSPRTDSRVELVLAVDEALATLESINPRFGRIVECRFFAGMTEEETAVAVDVPLRTVQREWARARAWLLKELG